LILEEYPDTKFFVPKKLAYNTLIMDKWTIIYGLKPQDIIKVIGKESNNNLIEVNKIIISEGNAKVIYQVGK